MDGANMADQYPTAERYLTLSELREKLGRRSRSAIYVDIDEGRLPRPLKLGGRLYWPEGELDAHLRALRAATAPEASPKPSANNCDGVEGAA
jgi:prophage regulatory protein